MCAYVTLLSSLFNGYQDQKLKKNPSSSPVQVELTCPIGKGLGRLCSNKIINLDEQEVTLGKQHLRAACPKTNRNSNFCELWKMAMKQMVFFSENVTKLPLLDCNHLNRSLLIMCKAKSWYCYSILAVSFLPLLASDDLAKICPLLQLNKEKSGLHSFSYL